MKRKITVDGKTKEFNVRNEGYIRQVTVCKAAVHEDKSKRIYRKRKHKGKTEE